MDFNIVCVYKSGNIFDWDYVHNLYYVLCGKLKHPFKFVCFTDTVRKAEIIRNNDKKLFTAIPFDFKLRKWWAKLEAFRLVGTVIYFDLDVAIIRNLNWTCEKMSKLSSSDVENSFYMLKIPLGKSWEWSSSIMAWTGDWSWLLTKFNPQCADIYDWEQKYISSEIIKKGLKINSSQALFRGGVYPYKMLKGSRTIPCDTSIVYFHGKPKPHEVGGMYFPILERDL